MKFFKLSFIAIVIFGAISCKKPGLVSLNITTDDAASILSGSITSDSYGFNNMSSDVTFNAQNAISTNQACGSTRLDTLIRSGQPNSPVNYSYKLVCSHKLTCNVSSFPDNISNIISYTGNYNNQRLSLSNSGTGNFTVAGLTQTSTVYALNGEYKSSGTFKLKSDTTNVGTANIDILVKNVVINKATQVISSGTSTVIVTGNTIKKGDFTYNGTLIFNGNSIATMTLNGTGFIVNLLTGDIVKK